MDNKQSTQIVHCNVKYLLLLSKLLKITIVILAYLCAFTLGYYRFFHDHVIVFFYILLLQVTHRQINNENGKLSFNLSRIAQIRQFFTKVKKKLLRRRTTPNVYPSFAQQQKNRLSLKGPTKTNNTHIYVSINKYRPMEFSLNSSISEVLRQRSFNFTINSLTKRRRILRKLFRIKNKRSFRQAIYASWNRRHISSPASRNKGHLNQSTIINKEENRMIAFKRHRHCYWNVVSCF